MGVLKSCSLAVLGVVAGVWTAGVSIAEERHFGTPEEAITAYIEGVKANDFDAVLATTAVDRMSKGFDFVAFAKRLNAITYSTAMPTTDPFFIAINKQIYTINVARHLQYLTYSLMTNSDVLKGVTVSLANNPTAADDIYTVVQAKRLAGLSIAKIGIPYPEDFKSDRLQVNFTKQAKIYGADIRTERVVLLSFDGLNYMIGFSLFRYGDDWLIDDQISSLAGTDTLGTATRMTPDDFEALTH
ncbi:hypothetical protein CXZ10_17265 [Pleomorphomonas diazotrophica]|uniref:Uncharacterized protein n=1 Tax=Pleomorphomonas diazotrophica TaxID=1166257 RepID=A0A1I4W4R4_9HYPH|nr:hypothetical protein [Pleomorphomonas diazotrophica]PKR87876.1 hypothetical protein CXZ10_17265 [Pleomorphomonas diazotrophica]SFN08598.1 hypothetical protein SAMN05192571_11529 [Pleomorphomonas diazotrophica]